MKTASFVAPKTDRTVRAARKMTQTSTNHVARTRVMVADDNQAIRELVVQILEAEFDVVGVASNGDEAVELAKRFLPEIGVLDITMPGKTGIEAAEELLSNGSKIQIVFLTVHEDPEFVRRALEIGASGYIAKRKMAKELTLAIKKISLGQNFISPCCSPAEY